MGEIWKRIDWIDGLKSTYEVSSCGRIRRIGGMHHTFDGEVYIKSNNYFKPSMNANGYLIINLYPFGKLKHFYVHHLVADAFLEKVDGKDVINHINENKTDNRVENLERCTRAHNVNHSKYKVCVPAKNFRVGQYGRNIKRSGDKYEVNCYHNGKSKYVGRFSDVIEARRARNNYLESLGLADYLSENELMCEA